MLKRLVIFAVFLVVFCLKCRSYQVQAKESNQKPPAPVSVIPQQQNDSTTLRSKEQQNVRADVKIVNPPEKDVYDKAPVWINLVLAIVGIAGVFVALSTLGKLERQTRTAEKQTNHIVASERAWLVICSVTKSGSVIKPGSSPPYWWQVKNLGSTPARLVATQAICKVCPSEKLSKEPIFPKSSIELHERILGPGDSLDFYSFWENDDGTVFRECVETLSTIWLRAYGYVTYKTIFGSEICESRFCDDFIHTPDKPIGENLAYTVIDFRPDLTAPAAYTKNT